MKKTIFILAGIITLIGVAFFTIIGIDATATRLYLANERVIGVYNNVSEIFMCEVEYACLHEVGHWLDDDLGYPSQSEMFHSALDSFIAWCDEQGGNPHWYCLFEIKESYSEMYAELYEFEKLHGIFMPYQLAIFFEEGWDE